MTAPAAVLAVGCPPPQADWATPALAADPRLVTDPWSPGRLTEIAGAPHRARSVLLVGAGLTMVDVALSVAARNPQAQITAVSRSGLLRPLTCRCRRQPIPTPAPPAVGYPSTPRATSSPTVLPRPCARPATGGRESMRCARSRPRSGALCRSPTGRVSFARTVGAGTCCATAWHRRSRTRSARLRRGGRLRVEALGERTIADYPWRQFDAVVACTGQGGPLSARSAAGGHARSGAVRPDPLGSRAGLR